LLLRGFKDTEKTKTDSFAQNTYPDKDTSREKNIVDKSN
jgi:hypothetical protein